VREGSNLLTRPWHWQVKDDNVDRKHGRDRSVMEWRPRPHVGSVGMIVTNFLFQKSHCLDNCVGKATSVFMLNI